MSSVITPHDGSTFYYTLLKTDPQQRSDVCALLRFCDVLASVLHDVTEPSVAEQKIHWWHQEVERLQNGDARHPAATIVYPVIQRCGISAEQFLPILQANNNEKFINATDEECFQQRLQQDYGTRLTLCLTVLSNSNNHSWQAQPEWAGALGTVDRLRQLVHLHHCAYPVLPDCDFQKAGIEPANLTHADSKAAAETLLAARIDQALSQIGIALAQTLNDDRLIPIYLYGKLRQAQLRLWQKNPLALLQQYTTLTPIRKLWICMRARPQLRSVRQST